MTKRFNSREYLAEWITTGEYPKIHNDMFNAVRRHITGSRVLDLGCSFGLLAQRLTDIRLDVIGVEYDNNTLQLSKAAGIKPHLYALRVDENSLDLLFKLIQQTGRDTIVARRVIPELFEYNIMLGHEFAKRCATHKIKQIFLEGRVQVPNAKSPLNNIQLEISLFTGYYTVIHRFKNIAVLKLNEGL